MRNAVIMYEANKRVGSASTKRRDQVAGSTRKPYRQKGTGHARAGSRRSPLWRGGGTTFGPKPRDYSYSMPKKARRAALQSALLAKLLDNEIAVIDKLDFEAPKTKRIAALLKSLGINDSCLIGIVDNDENLWKSVRNLPRVSVCKVSDFNAYEVLKHKRLLLTKDAFESICTVARDVDDEDSSTDEAEIGCETNHEER